MKFGRVATELLPEFTKECKVKQVPSYKIFYKRESIKKLETIEQLTQELYTLNNRILNSMPRQDVEITHACEVEPCLGMISPYKPGTVQEILTKG